MTLSYRWLGVAGLEFRYDNYTLLVDPFFTRPSKLALLIGQRVQANSSLVARHITGADAVLVTHPHYDHLLDVPEVLRLTSARAYGSANACSLLALHSIPAEQACIIKVGDRLNLGPFSVEVLPANHTRVPFPRLYNGALPLALRRGSARLPLRLSDYRMDVCYSFNIQVGGRTFQVGKQPVPADVLFLSPYDSEGTLGSVLRAVQPRRVVPIHWDDFTRPLSRPLRTMLLTPAQGLRPIIPPVRRLSLAAFVRNVRQVLPDVEVSIPEIFQFYQY